jgi:hypothetical protein
MNDHHHQSIVVNVQVTQANGTAGRDVVAEMFADAAPIA